MNAILKRAIDLSLATIGIVLFSFLFIVISIWIKLDSNGPVLYYGKRIGQFNKPFYQYKFRTMIINADKIGSSRTANNDTRITKSGKILRLYKLDELPQLFNIIKDDMSFVGPRPDVEEYVSMYKNNEKDIMNLKPGITDWATLWYRDEGGVLEKFEDPDMAYKNHFHDTKVKLQLSYLNNNSIITDIAIIIFTCISVFKKDWLPAMLAKRLSDIGESAVLAIDKNVI